VARDLRYGSLTHDGVELCQVAEHIFTAAPEDPLAGSDAGFFGVGTREDDGGSGGTIEDVAVLVESAGACAAATSIASTALVAAPLLLAYAADPEPLLQRLLSATAQVVVPVRSPWQFAADASGDLISFEHTFLGGGSGALVLVPRIVSGVETVMFREADTPGLTVSRMSAMDPRRPTWRVSADGVSDADATAVISGEGLFGDLMARNALAVSLDAVGAARSALAKTLTYAEIREQFGRPIGSFQAYKHRCADALIQLTMAQSLAFNAATQLAAGDRLLALCAGRLATTNATYVCGEAVQLHGAIGFTWEAGIHALLKRARLDEIVGRGCRQTREMLVDLDIRADQRSQERAAG
jgi:alkylation response protein AidB-like acyl-CoA dehydrogenase